MATIVVIVFDQENPRQSEFFTGVTDARRRAKKYLKIWLSCWGRDSDTPGYNQMPRLAIEKWEVKTGKAQLVRALQPFTEIEVEETSPVECWSICSEGKTYKWDGSIKDDPDLTCNGFAEETVKDWNKELAEQVTKDWNKERKRRLDLLEKGQL